MEEQKPEEKIEEQKAVEEKPEEQKEEQAEARKEQSSFVSQKPEVSVKPKVEKVPAEPAAVEQVEEKAEEPEQAPVEEEKPEPEPKPEPKVKEEKLVIPEKKPEERSKKEEKKETKKEPKEKKKATIYALRTTANREDQVMDFVTSNASKKGLDVYAVIRPHGMRGYIFVEAGTRTDAEQAAFNVPYARGILPSVIDYKEIEHMLEQVKKDVNIKKNDIAEIISGPFKREKCKITRIDKTKEEVVVELLEAAVPIPITVKMDAVKVIRRESDDDEEDKE